MEDVVRQGHSVASVGDVEETIVVVLVVIAVRGQIYGEIFFCFVNDFSLAAGGNAITVVINPNIMRSLDTYGVNGMHVSPLGHPKLPGGDISPTDGIAGFGKDLGYFNIANDDVGHAQHPKSDSDEGCIPG